MPWAPKGVTIGRGSYFGGAPTILWDKYKSKIVIGNYTSIAAEVTFFLGGHHDIQRVSMRHRGRGDKGLTKGDILIGNDCWIGCRATIMDGVTIADGAVVGACSVVAGSVPPYAVAVGNPAKVVKFRFDNNTIQALLDIRWWDWPPKMIFEAGTMLRNRDVAAFIEKYRKR
jgi:acetyltransferase-like isoleucine patch superfamily enzyme